MKFTNLHLALREIRDFIGRPRVVAVLLGVALLATVAQPFGFRVPGHIGLTLIFWNLVIWITFPLGFAISLLAEGAFKNRLRYLGIGIAAIVMGVATTLIVYALNTVFLGWSIANTATWGILFSSTFPTAALVTCVIGISMGNGQPQTNQTTAAPTLLDRLKFDLRGPILHLAAEDHYTRVTTTKGEALILIRFSDAVAEVAPTAGFQTHRSHWVAATAIKGVSRQGDGASITLKNGAQVPVSRSKIKTLQEAGFL